jgi:hypothetical protein
MNRSRWRWRHGAWLLIAAAAVVPCLETLAVGFVSDDFIALARYRDADVPPLRFALDAILTMARVPTLFYRPLAFVTLWAETRLWGAWALPFHLTNLLLHAAVCLLAFALVRRVAQNPNPAKPRDGIASASKAPDADREAPTGASAWLAGAMAVVLFALFPRRVEAIAWVACRPDLLAAALAVAAALVYARALRRSATAAGATAAGATASSIVAAALWFVSLLAKESALLLPAALWALPHPAPRTRRALAIPFGVAFAAYLALRRTALGMWVGGYGADQMGPSPLALLRAVRHVAYLLLPPIAAADDSVWIARLAAVVMVALLALLAWQAFAARRDPLVRFGAAWIAVTVLPVAALPVSLATTFNDRLLYLPGVGMACLLAGLLPRLASRALLLVTLPLALLFGADTVRTTHHWRVASDMSDTLIRGLVTEVEATWPAPAVTPPAERTLYLSAVPDSYRGAYVLRTSIADALRFSGLEVVPKIVVLSRYFVDDESVMTVTSSRKAEFPGKRDPSDEPVNDVAVQSCGDRPALLADPSSMPFATFGPAGMPIDRYGRFLRRDAPVPDDARVLLLTPRGIHPIVTGAPAPPCGAIR